MQAKYNWALIYVYLGYIFAFIWLVLIWKKGPKKKIELSVINQVLAI